MSNLVILIPVALFLGAVGLLAFLWALRRGQYEDMDGAAARVLLDDDDPAGGKRSVGKIAIRRRAFPNGPDQRD